MSTKHAFSAIFGLALAISTAACSTGLPSGTDAFVNPDDGVINDMSSAPDMAVNGTQTAKYVMSKLTLPTSATSSAYDLDGDGTPDNHLGGLMQALTALGLDAQTGTTSAVTGGSLVLLLTETSTDPLQRNAVGAGTTLSRGAKTTAPPKFDGTDTFVVDTSAVPGQFTGPISLGVFNSTDPATATTPVTLTIALPLFPGSPPVMLPVTGAHIAYTRGLDGKITGGQLNGAITQADMNTVVYPALAVVVTAQVQAPGASSTIKMFDTNMDGTVTAAELMGNALVSGFFAPDVQLFQGGVYKPNPAKTAKDCWSLGFAFEAAPATF